MAPMLAVSDLDLSHFRSHRRLRLDLGPGPVAIFGPNGAGKTNILEAVSLLSPGRGLRGAGAEEIARRPEGVGWRVRAGLEAPGGAARIELRAEPGQPRRTEIDGQAVPQVALGRAARILWLVPAMDRLWIEGAEGRRRFLDRIALSFEPTHAEASLAYDKAMRERNRLLRDGISDAHWYGALERTMAQAGAAIQDNRAHALQRLAEAQEGAATAFPAARLGITGDEAAGEDALRAAFAAKGRRDDIYAGRTLAGPPPGGPRGRVCRQGDRGQAVLHRRAEGAAPEPDPRQRPRAGAGSRRAADPACWTRSAPISTPPAAPPFTPRSARSGRRLG